MEKQKTIAQLWKQRKDKATTRLAAWIVALLVIIVRRLNRGEQKLSIAQKKRILVAGFVLASLYLLHLLFTALSAPVPRSFPDTVIDSTGTQINRHERPALKT